MSVITLPQSISAVAAEGMFGLQRAQEALTTIAGVDQITSYPDRRWICRIEVKPRSGATLLAWSLAVDQLSDITNVFAVSPPHYDAPGTGYAGSNPLVAGASQLGLSLAVDGLPNSTNILSAGDFISFDVTTALGNTNRQLNKVTADVASNGSGEATLPLLVPIREAPANNATVELFTPSAFFRFLNPQALVNIDTNLFAPFSMDCVERIFP